MRKKSQKIEWYNDPLQFDIRRFECTYAAHYCSELKEIMSDPDKRRLVSCYEKYVSYSTNYIIIYKERRNGTAKKK